MEYLILSVGRVASRSIAKPSAIWDIRQQVSLADSSRPIAFCCVPRERRQNDEIACAHGNGDGITCVDVTHDEAVFCDVMF